MRLPLGPMVNDPVDLMSTTAVAGVFSGRELLLGSTGDSRTYLVRDGNAEQLTMDGDVRCLQLAQGMPPEEVAEQGSAALALYHCLGIGERGPDGLVHDDERGRPFLSLYHLIPGDVIVLCSDGLVEEGVFLGARELAALVSGHTGPGLAQALVEAACALHRPPAEGVEGSGDDVTCVVVRAFEATT
jgi:serine/threonine protein phosphatase PrpC